MVEEGPYEILPYAEIEKLKKQVEDLKKSSASSEEILDAINKLTKIMESMLHLFESAAEGMKKEGEGSLGKKLDQILDQNETIAEGILSVVDMIKEFEAKKEPYVAGKPLPVMPQSFPSPRIEPGPDFSIPPPSFERQRPVPPPITKKFPMVGPGPIPQPPFPREGPMSMPTGSFKDLSFEKPKKGLFGKFRK